MIEFSSNDDLYSALIRIAQCLSAKDFDKKMFGAPFGGGLERITHHEYDSSSPNDTFDSSFEMANLIM